MPPKLSLPFQTNRRDFLKRTGGGLVLAVGGGAFLTACGEEEPSAIAPGDGNFGAFLEITGDDRVRVLICQAEMGQGIASGLAQIVADELGARWDQVETDFVTGRPDYFHPVIYSEEQITGGSTSIMGFEAPMRKAAAAARAMLIAAAAERLNRSADGLTASDGVISVGDGVAPIPFGDLAEAAARLDPPEAPPLKPDSERSLVGQPVPRLDIPEKVLGAARFGTDMRVPNMAFAAVRCAPVMDSELASYDASLAKAMPGVVGVWELPRGLGVVADNTWRAMEALKSVDMQFTATPYSTLSMDVHWEDLARMADEGEAMRIVDDGPVDEAFAHEGEGAHFLDVRYRVPFLAHATMEPMNATAHVTEDGAELWVPTQAPTIDEIAVAEALGISREAVTIHMTYSGGGFGRRGMGDFSVQAALLSRAAGRPVQVMWSREEDMAQDFFRPAFAGRLKGRISAGGRIEALDAVVAGPGVWTANRPSVAAYFEGRDLLAYEGLSDMAYRLPAARVQWVPTDPVTRIGYWRSIGYTHNTFFLECFLDELAAAADTDPLELRRQMLGHDPRGLKVLETAAERAGWAGRKAEGRHLGIGYFAAERWRTRVAQIAEVEREGQTFRLKKMTLVADIGQAINPDSVEAQLEGACTFGLCAALYGEITLENGRAAEANFPDYPLVALADCPEFDVTVIEGGGPPGAAGEVATPCAAPAVANALFAATGAPVRSLPLAREGYF